MQVTGSRSLQPTGRTGCATAICGVLRSNKAKFSVAVDPVGPSPGNWCSPPVVQPHRFASGNPIFQTISTNRGIIDSGNQMA